jgi:hypothetical protein
MPHNCRSKEENPTDTLKVKTSSQPLIDMRRRMDSPKILCQFLAIEIGIPQVAGTFR